MLDPTTQFLMVHNINAGLKALSCLGDDMNPLKGFMVHIPYQEIEQYRICDPPSFRASFRPQGVGA